jgi:putative oxidoreductase
MIRGTAAAPAGSCLLDGVILHGYIADQAQMVHLLKNVAMAGGLLERAADGAGRYSVDGCGRGRTGG